jgi:hypothetical protein
MTNSHLQKQKETLVAKGKTRHAGKKQTFDLGRDGKSKDTTRNHRFAARGPLASNYLEWTARKTINTSG